MAIVVEVLNSGRRVIQRYLIEKNVATIGRAYSNDVVLDDFHVDLEHAIISLSDDQQNLLLEDRGSLNGIRDQKKKKLGANVGFTGETEVVLGETRLRLRDTNFPLKETLKIKDDSILRKVVNHPLTATFCFLLANCLMLYQLYVDNVDKVEMVKYVQNAAWFSLALVGFALLVSFVGKVFRREWRFVFILFFLSFLGIVEDVGTFIFSVLAFNIYLVKSQWLIDAIWMTMLSAFLAWGLTISAFKMRSVFQYLLVGCVGVIVFSLSSLQHIYNDSPKYLRRPPLTHIFMSPEYQLAKSKSDEVFLEEAQSVFEIEVKEK